MLEITKIILLTTIIFGCMVMERYSSEKDITRQLTKEGRTHFIFLDDIKIKDIEVIKEK